MAYRFMSVFDLYAYADTTGEYKKLVESALNNLEKQGWLLDTIQPGAKEEDAYFAFRSVQQPPTTTRKSLNS